ncbi:DUF1317 family protein [Escherichia coli]|uniref:DUF1317 family protein n=1 Tax=Escherichia coli TaxID=562 RepID=UPI0015EE48DD|nr:DUF1317 family protein [Escherichia coli]
MYGNCFDVTTYFLPSLGAITFVYSVTKRGWVFPGLSVIQNPLKAQRLAEEINNKRGLYD